MIDEFHPTSFTHITSSGKSKNFQLSYFMFIRQGLSFYLLKTWFQRTFFRYGEQHTELWIWCQKIL